LGNLATPESVRKLQMALHAKAKAEPGFRFYALYDKISRDDILAHAWVQCRSNKGAPGVDGRDFGDIEAYGVERWLGELALALREESYRPDPIRRVFIPKANGKLRPLGISTLRDRVCMTAAMLVLEPIFEADLPPEQYAYRPGRNAQQAAVDVKDTLFYDHPEVVDADLADYFGSIPHAELMLSLARRIVDRRVLHLIKMWLECSVEETDDRGRKTRTTEAKDQRRGIPQGSPLSPLLANLYMRRFVLGWKKLGLEKRLGTRIVTYADDLVILCRKGKAEQALQHLRAIMGKLKLTVNEEKTRICKVPEHGRKDSCADGNVDDVARDHALGGQVEPRAARLGELLRSSQRQPRLPGDRQLHRGAVTPVVADQVQEAPTPRRGLSTLDPLRPTRARTADLAGTQPLVGEGVKSCPRAGCGRSARPVR
jgi:RNA-directed DNA polymerase